uniref:Sodium channel and clathrin linker 1 n=1 Tax=Salmo trutta TaxID=8032 RepID=A0A673W6X9_SALTR
MAANRPQYRLLQIQNGRHSSPVQTTADPKWPPTLRSKMALRNVALQLLHSSGSAPAESRVYLFLSFHSYCRSAKADLRMATAKVEEMTKLMQNIQDQIQRREDDAAEAHGREEASDRRLHHLQSALSQLEARLKAASQEAESVRREQVVWERQVGELQVRCASLEEERYEAFSKVRDSIQLAEEASLQKDQALLREKQKSEELDKMNEAIRQLIQDAAIRTRKEVENVRKQCNSQIHRMAEELSALQLECADKESQMERSLREMRAVEEELEKVYKEGRGEPEYRKMEALHQRSLNAERLKDDMNITLQSTHNKMKKMEMDYSEELSRCQEEVRRLQGSLSAAREDCSGVSEERLQLQQENMQLRREMEELRKASMMTQRRAKQQVSQMEQEYSLKEQGLDARVRELEESSRSSSAELTRLLSAQQKTSQRWKEEAKTLTLTFHTKLTSLKLVQCTGVSNVVVEMCHIYQEKNSRLQRRLTQAEQKATTASQQVLRVLHWGQVEAHTDDVSCCLISTQGHIYWARCSRTVKKRCATETKRELLDLCR